MPQVEVNGQLGNISSDKLDQFAKDYPNAKIHYNVNGNTGAVSISKRQSFLKDYPSAEDINSNQPVSQQKYTNFMNLLASPAQVHNIVPE